MSRASMPRAGIPRIGVPPVRVPRVSVPREGIPHFFLSSMQTRAEQEGGLGSKSTSDFNVTDADVYYVMDATRTFDYQVVVEAL